MGEFWKDVWYELTRMVPRTLYFLRTGHLHPEVDPLAEFDARRRAILAGHHREVRNCKP